MPTTYLVTGGAGFIGSHLVERLVEDGHRVRVIDNLFTGRRENLAPLLERIDFVEGDIRDLETVRHAMEGIEVVFHQAAAPSVPRSVKDPATSNAVNVGGTLNVLIAARDAGIRRVVYASSSSIYGNNPELPKRESMAPAPASPYAVSKLAAEQYCRVFTEVYGLETVALRYFNVFGPRQDPDSPYGAAIPKFIAAYLNGAGPTILGDGEQSRGFTYIDNVVNVNLLAASADSVSGDVFNVAGPEPMTLNTLDSALRRILDVPDTIVPSYGPPRTGDVRHSAADVTKAANRLGYRILVDVHEGLKRTVAWYRSLSA